VFVFEALSSAVWVKLSPLPALAVDAEGRVLDMNPAGLGMIQAENLEQVRGLEITQVIAPEHRAAFLDLHRRVFTGESGTLEFEIIGMKGRRRWLATHVVPLRDASGTIQAALGLTRDITETRRAEQQLRASRAALRSLATREQDIRESERTRIAREIHDSLGQALTALKLQLAAAQDAAMKEAPALGGRLHETAVLQPKLLAGGPFPVFLLPPLPIEMLPCARVTPVSLFVDPFPHQSFKGQQPRHIQPLWRWRGVQGA